MKVLIAQAMKAETKLADTAPTSREGPLFTMPDTQPNHIIVGLGGTGGKTLRSFRKSLYASYRQLQPEGINLGYLYIDSTASMMSLEDPTWKILGTTVQLPPTSQITISGTSLGDVLDNAASFPGIAPWIGNKDKFRSILRGADSANVVGGQKRRLGRFLFAYHVSTFRSRLQAIVRELQVGNSTATTFHFVVGLAGGTGAGALVDAIAQTRAMFPTPEYRIIVYALLPDKNPKPNRAGDNYHANGYATLLELNALDIGTYFPIDIASTIAGRERLDLRDPFNVCYLFTDENEDRLKVDIDTELPDIVGQFLLQKIVNARDFVWASADGDAIARQERFELGSQADEKEKSPATGRPERTRRFFSFGTKQIAYPEEEIREYLTYLLARQAALQLQFDHFTESGYIEESKNIPISEYVRSPENRRTWRLLPENLMLSDGILPDERSGKWKPFERHWNDLLGPLKSVATQNAGSSTIAEATELQKLFVMQFDQQFRDAGVARFFDLKRGDIPDYCREIRRAVETDLFGAVINGTRSVTEADRILKALVTSLGEQRRSLAEFAERNGSDEKTAAGQLTGLMTQWGRVGVLGSMLGARKRLFEQIGEALVRVYTLRTQGQALRFASALLDAVIEEITSLGNEAATATANLASAVKDFTTAVGERLSDRGEADVAAQVVRFYKPETIRSFGRDLERNVDQQKLQTSAVRAAIASRLGEVRTFAAFNARLGVQDLKDTIEAASEQNVENAHAAFLAADATRERVLTVNVLDRLKREYGGNPAGLRSYITSIVSRAKTQIVFNTSEQTRVLPGTERARPMFPYTTVIVPEGKDQASFRASLIDEINSALTTPHEIVTNPKRQNEVTILNVTSAFPARFVQDVAFLKDRYEARVAGPNANEAKFELHTEDNLDLPSLFPRKITRADTLPLLLVAQAMSLVQRIEDPVTGLVAIYLVTSDATGRDNDPIKLGRDLSDAADSVDPVVFDSLESTIAHRLKSDYLHVQKRQEIAAAVRGAVTEAVSDRPNPLDPLRKEFMSADRAVEAMLKTEQ